MHIDFIKLNQFKNHEDSQYEFCRGVNCLIGENGVGKTNVIDAIYFLCYCKSYFNLRDHHLIKDEQSGFSLLGNFEADKRLDIQAIYKGGRKVFKQNGKRYDRLFQHIGKLNAVMVTPADITLIHDASDSRRRFVDGLLAQVNEEYLSQLMKFKKLLDQRNQLLKQFLERNTFDENMIQVYEESMLRPANFIYEKRKTFLESFLPFFNKYYKVISGNKEKVDIKYKSELSEKALTIWFQESRNIDRYSGRTSHGIHRDDFIFTIDEKPVKKFASQGQTKSFLIALKLAQFFFIQETSGITPILLLDDIFEKIDEKRAQSLIDLLGDSSFDQIILSDTHAERAINHLKPLSCEKKFIILEGSHEKKEGHIAG